MEAQFVRQLKGYGYSLTKARLAVFHYLRRYGARSMPELVHELSGELDRASLYRTLELYERLGIVQQVGLGRQRRYELSDRYDAHHHHFTCSNCELTESIEDVGIEDDLKALALRHGFVLTGHQLELQGLCRACAKVRA